VGLAETHETRFEEAEGHYLCHSCRVKAAEWEENKKKGFLKDFYDQVPGASELVWPNEADDVAQYDPRGYVAYIVADGDGMGRVFGACSKEQAARLSEKMDAVLREALAEPTSRFMRNEAARQNPNLVPVLPLILGGDDLFALVPARWGLDFARRLCRTFQREMTAFVRDEEITLKENGQEKDPTITMSAAVVICKANYPYYLAHQIGEERLGATKRAVKALGDAGTRLSAVDFEVVLGSQAAPDVQTGKRRRTLRPYWVPPEGEGGVPDGWGLAMGQLLDWRHQLVGTPSRRRSQMREHFDRDLEDVDGWNAGLRRILARIERDWTRDEKHPVRRALEALGGVDLDDWYELARKNDEDFHQGHGLPDLLRAWDWALSLDHSPIAYEGGER
jgi:hypothetical protein